MTFKELISERKITNSEIEDAVRNKEDFVSNTAKGYTDSELGYVVKSYETIIYSDKDGLNTTKYSITTSKVQNSIKRAFNL